MGSESARSGETPDPAAPAPTLTVHAEDDDHRVATFGPVVLSVWIRDTRVPALRAMEQIIRAAAPGAPDGRVGLFVVVERGSTGLPSASRDELTRIRRTGLIALTVLVYEGEGFKAALVRGITTSLNLLEPAETQTQVFSEVLPAARWIEAKAPQYGQASALEEAVRALRVRRR